MMVRPLAMLALVAAQPGVALPVRHATGTFEVTVTPEAQAPAPPQGLPTGRMALAKTFSGGLAATAVGTMISVGVPHPGAAAAYVALDQVTGTLDGRSGGFVLIHRGTMTKAGDADLEVTVVPDSGTGQLAGITGQLIITVEGGKHHYDLAYTLPDRGLDAR